MSDSGGRAPRPVEVADRVYAYIQPDGSRMINNTGLIVGQTSTVLVDTCATERRTRALLDAIAGLTDTPVRTVVNTHSHPDHTNGNYLFPQATIVAHEHCRTVMGVPRPETPGVWPPIDWGDLQPRLPDVTYPDRLTLWAGDLEVTVLHPGRTAHTTGDSLVWIRSDGCCSPATWSSPAGRRSRSAARSPAGSRCSTPSCAGCRSTCSCPGTASPAVSSWSRQ